MWADGDTDADTVRAPVLQTDGSDINPHVAYFVIKINQTHSQIIVKEAIILDLVLFVATF